MLCEELSLRVSTLLKGSRVSSGDTHTKKDLFSLHDIILPPHVCMRVMSFGMPSQEITRFSMLQNKTGMPITTRKKQAAFPKKQKFVYLFIFLLSYLIKMVAY